MKPLARREEKHLADVLLADAEWHQFQDNILRSGLSALAASARSRGRRIRTANVSALALLAAGLCFALVFHSPRATRSTPLAVAEASKLPSISEREVAALFPPGTCVFAQVNGEERLVILDAKIAEEGFLVADGSRGNPK
jgi:hypothetical protein